MDCTGTKKVRKLLESNNLLKQIRTFERPTRTADEAAKALGCKVGQIAKSIIFQIKGSDNLVLIIVSGSNRVDEELFERKTGIGLKKADAEKCENVSGFVIGGIPPLGHKNYMRTFMDKDLLKYKQIWASAGGTNSVFNIKTKELVELIRPEILEVC